MATLTPRLSQRQIVASIAPMVSTDPALNENGKFFSQVSGGEISASPEKVWEGGENFPITLCSPAEIGDITLTRPYSKDEHGPFLAKLRSKVGKIHYTITVTEMDCDLVPDPDPQRVYANALLTGLTEPEGDAASGAAATFTLTFTPSAVAEPGS